MSAVVDFLSSCFIAFLRLSKAFFGNDDADLAFSRIAVDFSITGAVRRLPNIVDAAAQRI